jgi:uncharacterized protein involved in exopolysaccharide biosynthesis
MTQDGHARHQADTGALHSALVDAQADAARLRSQLRERLTSAGAASALTAEADALRSDCDRLRAERNQVRVKRLYAVQTQTCSCMLVMPWIMSLAHNAAL